MRAAAGRCGTLWVRNPQHNGGIWVAYEPHAAEREKLGQIDYFLAELARAIDAGEIPFSAYEVLAPRYLALREDLVATITSPPRRAVLSARAQEGLSGQRTSAGEFSQTLQPQAPPARAAAYRPAVPPKPVPWTTVLLFLGAFLVIVAAAIFSVAVWNTTGVVFKLGFLGGLTAAFYAAGHFARTKFELPSGGAALTVVGSAMLLFDCWIVISGFHLTGTLPWAVALLLCSGVYWFTEVALGDRFYGIAGAAAQVGWWWLMAAGLDFTVPVRLAGIAVIALLWQLVAERAEDSDTFGSLATVLLWSAPLVTLLASVGIAADALFVGTSTWTVVGSAVAVALATGVVVLRCKLLPRQPARWLAGAGQLALFVVVLIPGSPSWLAVALMATTAAVYTLTSVKVGGAPFAVAAVGMELLAVLGAMSLLHASDQVTVGALALLAVTWVIASVLAQPLDVDSAGDRWSGANELSVVVQLAAVGLLTVSSGASVVAAGGIPLSGVSIAGSDAVLAAVVLAAWVAASFVRRNPVTAFAASLWSFYTFAAVAAVLSPNLHSASYALALLALAGSWLALRGGMDRLFQVDAEAFGWLQRGLAAAILLGGLAAESYFFESAASWPGVVLALGAAALFLADTEFGGPALSASAAGATIVGAAYLAGLAAGGSDMTAALAAASAGLVASVGGALASDMRARYSGWLAAAAASVATFACFAGADGWGLAGAFALVSLAWAAVAVAAREEWFALPAGLAAFGVCAAAVAAADAMPSITVVTLSAAGLALGVPAYFSATGPDGRRVRTGSALSAAGLISLVGFAVAGWAYNTAGELFGAGSRWIDIGGHGEVVVLLMLGAYIIAQAERWGWEPGTYIGAAVILLAVFFEMNLRGVSTTEFYSTTVAAYLIVMGELYAWRKPERTVPQAIDVAAVAVGLGIPALLALQTGGALGMVHVAWTVGLSLVALTAGVVLRVRAYFLGGVAAIALVIGWRSLTYLAQVWWVLLGLIGIAMLVIALTWERQRVRIADTRRQLRDSLETWR